MLELNSLCERKRRYTELKEQLTNTDIEAEVEKRLKDEKERLTLQIKTEIDADITKCDHYIEILDSLIDEATNIPAEVSTDDNNVDVNDMPLECHETYIGG